MTVRYRSKRTGSIGTYDEPFAPYELSDVWERIEEAPKPEPKPLEIKPEPQPTPEPPKRRPGRPRKVKAGE